MFDFINKTDKERQEISIKESAEIEKKCPKAKRDSNYNYYCVICGEQLKAYYGLKSGYSIGLACPKCGKVHKF